MFFWMILKVAIKALWANKLRSVLAMLGIIIGVGAVISMLALGAGAQQQVIEQYSKMGANLLIVRPSQRGSGGVMSGTQQNLTLDDAAALLNVPGVHAIAPVVGGSAQVKYMSKNTRTNVMGTAMTYLPMRAFEVANGESFTDSDVDRSARAAIIGPVTADNLFGPVDPLGKTIKLNGINFRVIGVTKSKGDQGWFSPDDQVLIPVTTAMKQVFGLEYLREIDIEAETGANLDELQTQTLTILRKRHKMQAGMPDDVNIRNQAEFIEAQADAQKTRTQLLGGVACISLLVGGIGIMNIMLVTVTERTREIGVRKAIGARNGDILRQFLIEALIMSGLGGLVGAGLGVAIALLPSLLRYAGVTLSFKPIVQPFSVLLALIFSAAVGIFFGFYPAWRASQLDPIEALRYE